MLWLFRLWITHPDKSIYFRWKLMASSYWWPPNLRHYFKHMDHRHYFKISLDRFVWFCFSSQCRYYCHILHERLVASSYWWPPKQGITSKQGPRHYFTISLTDLFDVVSVHNVATIVIYYMNFWSPSSYWWPPKPKHYSKTGTIDIISQFLLQICLMLFQFTMSLLLSYNTRTFGRFLILVTSKIKVQDSLKQSEKLVLTS